MDAGTGVARQARRHAWTAGVEGERRVGARLDELGPGWRVLHDVRRPGRPRANLDHVAVGPTGIWVVDAKSWSGAVSVREGVVHCGGWRKVKETEALAAAGAAVAALLQPVHRELVRPVLCLAGSGSDLGLGWAAGGTRVVGVDALTTKLTAPEVCLQPMEVTAVADHLARELRVQGHAPVASGSWTSRLRATLSHGRPVA